MGKFLYVHQPQKDSLFIRLVKRKKKLSYKMKSPHNVKKISSQHFRDQVPRGNLKERERESVVVYSYPSEKEGIFCARYLQRAIWVEKCSWMSGKRSSDSLPGSKFEATPMNHGIPKRSDAKLISAFAQNVFRPCRPRAETTLVGAGFGTGSQSRKKQRDGSLAVNKNLVTRRTHIHTYSVSSPTFSLF